jgi:hypothetical protein
VLIFDHFVEVVIEFESDAVAEFVDIDHCCISFSLMGIPR